MLASIKLEPYWFRSNFWLFMIEKLFSIVDVGWFKIKQVVIRLRFHMIKTLNFKNPSFHKNFIKTLISWLIFHIITRCFLFLWNFWMLWLCDMNLWLTYSRKLVHQARWVPNIFLFCNLTSNLRLLIRRLSFIYVIFIF